MSFMDRLRSPTARRVQRVLMIIIALSMLLGYVM